MSDNFAAFLLDRMGYDAAPEAVAYLEPTAAAFGKAIANAIMAGDVWQRTQPNSEVTHE